jgi:hypothetical protein
MSNPKYARRQVRIDPRLVLPPGIEGVSIDDSKSVTAPTSNTSNGYAGGVVRDERPTNIKPTNPDPVTAGTNPWGIAKIKEQNLIINADGQLVVEVVFELPDWPGGYESRVSRV